MPLRRQSLVLTLAILLSTAALAQEAPPAAPSASPPASPPASELFTKLKALPHVVNISPLRAGRGRGGPAAAASAPAPTPAEAYELTFDQPVDHQHPEGQHFQQHVYVSHAGYDKPVLLGTEGYAANGIGGGELQRMLGGNQVTVEHRYFGKSVPSPLDWQYLTVKNSADDMHAIVSAMKTLYPGKWVSTGASKGGQTSLFYKCYYPDDVDATVAYVAPVNVTQEDPRINMFLQTTGDAATRQKIKDLQISLFKNEEAILSIVKADAEKKRWTFAMTLPKAYEYGVLEYPYAFWQYGAKPEEIPAADSPPETLATYYIKIGTLRYYSDQGKKQFEPFLYQAFTEIGYYNYDTTDFKPYMKALTNPTNLDICPDGAKIVFNPATMYFVYNFLQYKANNIVFIYGDLDAWSATQMQLIGRTNAIKIVVKDAHHGARIAAFSPEQKELFYTNMDQWLGMTLPRQ